MGVLGGFDVGAGFEGWVGKGETGGETGMGEGAGEAGVAFPAGEKDGDGGSEVLAGPVEGERQR